MFRQIKIIAPVIVLLFGAVCLKAYKLLAVPDEPIALIDSRAFQILLVEFELFLGFWLLSGKHHVAALATSLFVFGFFLIVSIVGAINGNTNCGCFGVFTVPPLVVVPLDAIAITSLLVQLNRYNQQSLPRHNQSLVTPIIGIVAMIGVLIPILTQKSTTLDYTGLLPNNSGIVIIEAEGWIGQRFPLERYVSKNDSLMNDLWDVMLYHESCPVCQDKIQETISGKLIGRYAFVEVPPYRSPARQSQSNLKWLRLSDSRNWFVQTPLTIQLENGIVTEVASAPQK